MENEVGKTWQVWHETEKIVLRRELGDSNVSHQKHHPNTLDVAANSATRGHKVCMQLFFKNLL